MGRGAQQRRQGRRPGYFSAVTSYFSSARSRSKVSTISAAETNQLSFRVLRKFGIRVLCVLRSDLAPEAWRRCHPMTPPITMTTSAMKSADPVTPASPPALPPRPGYRGARQRYRRVSDTAALTIPLCAVNCAAIEPLHSDVLLFLRVVPRLGCTAVKLSVCGSSAFEESAHMLISAPDAWREIAVSSSRVNPS